MGSRNDDTKPKKCPAEKTDSGERKSSFRESKKYFLHKKVFPLLVCTMNRHKKIAGLLFVGLPG
jgi:hypothetical protein